jgi:oligopeptidase A
MRTVTRRNLSQGAKLRFLTKTLDSFRRHGAELDAAGKNRLAEIDVELTKWTTKFSENVLDSTNAFELIITDEAKLAGFRPARSARRGKARNRRVRLAGDSPCRRPATPGYDLSGRPGDSRESVPRQYRARATEGSATIARSSRAFWNCAAKKRACWDFPISPISWCTTAWRTRGARHEVSGRSEGPTDPAFARRMPRSKPSPGGSSIPGISATTPKSSAASLYEFDEEELRPYFPAERVVEGMFAIVERSTAFRCGSARACRCGIRTSAITKCTIATGLLLGAFYADWFPRETKRDGAWMEGFITGVDAPGNGFEPHVGCVCGNLTPPIGDKPALLTHREVETIFHEFGHLLHHVLSRVEVKSLAGTAVAWDFVELPSQIMENWCWEREALDLFARHYQTGAKRFRKTCSGRWWARAPIAAPTRRCGSWGLDLWI